MRSLTKGFVYVVFALFFVLLLFGCGKHSGSKMERTNKMKDYHSSGIAKGVGRNINTDIEVELNIENNVLKDISFKENIESFKKDMMLDLLGYIKSMLVGKDKIHIDAISEATETIHAVNYAIIDAFDKGGFDKEAFGINDSIDKSYIIDGIYEGECVAMNDIIRVQVTLKDKKIADVKVVYEKETPGLGGYLKDKNGKILTYGGVAPISIIPEKIVEYQTLNVDAVSGATVTSDAIKIACRRALDKAGCKEYDFSTICRREMEAKDVDTDVLIIGAGGAGMVSAISAANNGAKVLLVEKNGQVGGDTLVCGAIYNTSDEELQKKIKTNDTINKAIESAINEKPISDEHKELIDIVKKEYEEHNKIDKSILYDSPSWHALQTFNVGDKIANLSLVKNFTSKTYDSYLWIKSLGVEFMDFASQAAGALWQRSHTTKMDMGTGLITAYVANIEKNKNIDLMLDTKCTELLYDGDKIVGAKCVTKDGKEFTVHSKSVILATGGFSANTDMIKKYNTSGKWDDLTMVKTTNRWTVSNGDGITLAENIGASLTDMKEIQLLYLSEVQNGQLAKYPIRCVQAIDQLIFVNKEGKRFVNEGGRRDEICLSANRQTDGIFYIIESGDGDKYIDIHDPSWRSADGFTFDYLVDNGYIYVADTLDELADKLSIDKKALNDTINKFNKSVDTGVDDFGRTLYTTKLVNGPFVATPRITAIHHTMGGVTIDENAHVIDKNGEVMNGFYACGEVTGGIHGANRLGGNAVTDTVVFGKIAGEEAARYLSTSVKEVAIDETAINDDIKIEDTKDDELKKFIEANTIDNILKNYLSVQYYDYELNNEGAKTVYFEGYEDRQKNRAIRYKDPSFNQEYSFQNLPYYIQVDGGKYEEVIGDDSAPLPKDHRLNQEENMHKDIISMNYFRKSIISEKANIIDNDTSGDVGILTVEIPYDRDKDVESEYDILYGEVLNVNNINSLLIEYEYDKNTLAIKKETDIAICDDGSSYTTANITFEYDVNILTAIKVVNDENGEVVYFDIDKLEKANIYNTLKKDLMSFAVNDVKYGASGEVKETLYIYKDVDGYAVIKDNTGIHVKYNKKWYDINNNKVQASTLSADQIKDYERDPVNILTGLRSLIDSKEKVITSYEDNGIGVIVQENKELDEHKMNIASTIPGIPNVVKTRREIRYDMDDDIVKTFSLHSYDKNGKDYLVEECDILLDENEPKELEKVMDYVDEMSEED